MINQNIFADLTIFSEENYSEFISQYPNKINSVEAHLLSQKAATWVSNVDTNIIVIGLKDLLSAASINYKEYDNALICSPYATYIKYPIDMIKQFDKHWIKALILCNAYITGFLYKATRINQVLQLDNYLYSLLKHPSYLVQSLPYLTKALSERYKNHTIAFFRVNEQLDKQLLDTLKKNGYIVFPDRIAHIFYPDHNYMKRSHTKRDISLLNKTSYKIIHHDELTEQDIDRICELYRLLFIDKHSKFNPLYTPEYFRQSIRNRWYDYRAFRHPNGQIDAFMSWFHRENIMICGPLGYDIKIDKKMGLYRMIIALSLKHAHENHCIFNLGSGSDEFKLNRGSTKTFEYTAVYCKHLPFYRHIPWLLQSKMHHALLAKIYQRFL